MGSFATAEDRRAAIAAAQRHLDELCSGKRRFTMSIPADPSRDSDLILEAALSAAEGLLSELEAAQARLGQARALHQRCDDGEQGYRPDGSYGTVAPCCKTCGSYGEYTEPWPCATARALGLGEEGTE